MNKIKSNIVLLISFLSITACSTVEPLANAPAIPSHRCDVQIFQTERQAAKQGPFEELCVINGTSSWSLNHTVQTAIEKHKDKACACGATHAYVQSRNNDPLGVATVTLIGIRYIKRERPQ